MTSTYLFSYVSTFSVILPIAGSLINFKSLDNKLRLFSIYLFITFLKESVCAYLAISGLQNLHLYNIFSIIEYLVYFYLYYSVFQGARLKNIVLAFSVITITVYLLDILVINGLYNFNTLTTTVGGFTIAVTTLLYFYQLIKGIEHSNLTKVPMFWISTGILFYSVGTIILFNYFQKYIHLPPSLRTSIWTINSVLNILQNILFTIGILCKQKNRI